MDNFHLKSVIFVANLALRAFLSATSSQPAHVSLAYSSPTIALLDVLIRRHFVRTSSYDFTSVCFLIFLIMHALIQISRVSLPFSCSHGKSSGGVTSHSLVQSGLTDHWHTIDPRALDRSEVSGNSTRTGDGKQK